MNCARPTSVAAVGNAPFSVAFAFGMARASMTVECTAQSARDALSLRPPQALSPARKAEDPDQVFRHEIMAEQASSLGAAGRRVEATLSRLRDYDSGRLAGVTRDTLLTDAAYAVWSFFVQRELMGLRHQAEVIRQYAIPKDVLVRVGQSPRKP